MNVTKRNGKQEKVNFNKITDRLSKLANQEPKLSVDVIQVSTKVINGLYDGVKTSELDRLAAETAATMSSYHPDYDSLAARVTISNLQKETSDSFLKKTNELNSIGILHKEYYDYVRNNIDFITSTIDYSRDFLYDYFGISTLKRSYLLKSKDGKIVERPQDMWIRVAIWINLGNNEQIQETYNLLSNKLYTHATPTLFNAGTVKPQLSSCFLLDIDSDSIHGIYKSLADCAKISQSAGGIGISISKIRGKGSYIHGTNGTSNGIVPMLRVFDTTARYVDQGGGRRKGSIAIYIEPWHSDIYDFLDLKKNHGKEELRARDLFYALWIPDLFMERVEQGSTWTLFDPAEAYYSEPISPDKEVKTYLYDCYGDEFRAIYSYLEGKGIGKEVQARELWERIVANQIETGLPYLLYKDACNEKSNQKNLGTIKSSNLCTEIIEYTSPEEIAVCNLASLSLPAFVDTSKNEYGIDYDGIDYEKLYYVTRVATRNLDNVIDRTFYPVPEAKNSNIKHRPIGLGVQGLADVFHLLKIPFDGQDAKEINKRIFETIYKAAVDESIELARTRGQYSSYEGSPASQEKLQFDLWGLHRDELFHVWDKTFENLRAYGLRNSLLVAPMPTASTSQILGNTECFEPITSNIYTRRTLAGEFIVVNRYLVQELIDLGIWDNKLRNKMIAANGSIAAIDEIPADVRNRYRTVWEMSMRDIINMAADRGPFICQSQSMNLFVPNTTVSKLTSMHFYGWKKGLKTGQYYLRTEAARDAIKFTVDKDLINEKAIEEEIEAKACSIDDPNCESCSG